MNVTIIRTTTGTEIMEIDLPPRIGPRCVDAFQTDSGEGGGSMGESARTANPVQTTAFFGVKKGFF